jgi:hypothetical protein
MNRRTILFVMTADTPDHQISDAAEAATAGSAPGRGVIPTVARAEWSLA